MCGIVGMFSRRAPLSEGSLQRATQSLFHRGPDGQRHWMSDDRRVALGHAPTLLALLPADPSALVDAAGSPIARAPASEDVRSTRRRGRRGQIAQTART